MSNVIEISGLSKQYRLGEVNTRTLANDINKWWHHIRGKESPLSQLGDVNDRTKVTKGDYVWALKDVNFSVKKGEVTAIIGRNGAGKSTLLKILSRTTLPTKGSVKIKGRIASLLEVGTGFHPELTGRDNIFLNGAILGMRKSEIKDKLDEIVAFSGVEKYIDTPVKRYSSGMYMRLAFSIAAHLESEILVVDEVLAVGDSEFQKKCLGRMNEVSKNDGRTVLFVSHSMPAVSNLCENAVVLNNGLVHSISDAQSGIQSYLALNRSNAFDNNLRDRTDRKGNGRFRFTVVEYLDGNSMKQVSRFVSGQNVVIRLRVELNMIKGAKRLVVAVGVNDMLDNRLCHISNELTDQSMSEFPDNLEYIDIHLDKLPLNSGTYNLSIFGSLDNDICDWIQNACYFEVEPGDFYNTGKSVTANASPFLVQQRFSFITHTPNQ